MEEPSYHGSCLCEGISFEIQGSPEKVFICYCQDCAKSAGAPYQVVCVSLIFFVLGHCTNCLSVPNSAKIKSTLKPSRTPVKAPGSSRRLPAEPRNIRNFAQDVDVLYGQFL